MHDQTCKNLSVSLPVSLPPFLPLTTQAPCITKVQNPEATATTLPAHHQDSASGAASTGGTAALAAAR